MGVYSGLSLFSGVGGLDIAAGRCGIRPIAYVEWDRYAQAVLMSRMRDGALDPAPIFSDITKLDGTIFKCVDVVFGGFPCQPHSVAGKRGGAADERNLWPDTMRVLRESEAWGFVGENVPGIVANGFAAQVLADLEREGFCGTPFSNTACAHGAPHPRQRVFFVAHSNRVGRRIVGKSEKNGCSVKYPQGNSVGWIECPSDLLLNVGRSFANPSSGVRRVDDGLSAGVERLKRCGNGVVAESAVPAFEKLISWREKT